MIPQQQQQMANLMAGMGVAFLLVWFLAYVFFVFLFWRVFTKAGMAGPLALISLIPGLGWIICFCILAFSRWRVAAVPPGYEAGAYPYPPQSYPPQNYPSAQYPPSGPPSQL